MNLKYIPNMLSFLRILLVPFYLLSLYLIGGTTGIFIALIIFITAGLTDWLDGYLARRLDCVTDLGKIIDPLADKMIVSVALISLAIKPLNMISFFPVVIILIRELSVTVLRKHFSRKNIYISANYLGKIKTVVQMTGIIAALLFSVAKEFLPLLIHYEAAIISGIRIFFWLVVVITIVSGLSYLTKPVTKSN